MVVKIVQKDDPVLRQTALSVSISDIQTPKIQKIISQMKEAMHSENDAVAIAAPQIGLPLQIFAVVGKYFDSDDMVFINPKILKLSKKKVEMEEGCLSARYLYGRVLRSDKATIEAYNEKGEKIRRGASGLLAQVFQHETDHLVGVLFLDKARDVVDIPPEKIKELERMEKQNDE